MSLANIYGSKIVVYGFYGVMVDVFIKDYNLRCRVPADLIEVSAYDD